MTGPLFAGCLAAFLALSIVLGLVIGPALKHARETQTAPAPEIRELRLHIQPSERAAFILGERMRLAFARPAPQPVDEFTVRLAWAFASIDEEVRS